MAIVDIAKTAQTPATPGYPCSVCQTVETLEPKESAALVGLLSDPAWRYQELSDRLKDEGIDLPANRLSRHARGQCAARTKLR